MKLLTALFFVFFIVQSGFSQDVGDIIEDVQETYDEVDDMSATFKRIESFKITGSVNETSGKIYIKGGVMYRFESQDQTIVTNGKTVWTYNAVSKQLIIDNVREESSAFLPRDMLFKYPKEYYSTLLGEEKIKGISMHVLKLDPRENIHGYVKSMKIWVDDDNHYIHQIETTDLNDNISKFEITNISVNKNLKDDFFTLQPTSEMQVVDMR
jgi:chaperone LolA